MLRTPFPLNLLLLPSSRWPFPLNPPMSPLLRQLFPLSTLLPPLSRLLFPLNPLPCPQCNHLLQICQQMHGLWLRLPLCWMWRYHFQIPQVFHHQWQSLCGCHPTILAPMTRDLGMAIGQSNPNKWGVVIHSMFFMLHRRWASFSLTMGMKLGWSPLQGDWWIVCSMWCILIQLELIITACTGGIHEGYMKASTPMKVPEYIQTWGRVCLHSWVCWTNTTKLSLVMAWGLVLCPSLDLEHSVSQVLPYLTHNKHTACGPALIPLLELVVSPALIHPTHNTHIIFHIRICLLSLMGPKSNG